MKKIKKKLEWEKISVNIQNTQRIFTTQSRGN